MKQILKNTYFRAGSVITGLMLLLILIGTFWTPYDPNAMNGKAKMMAPGLTHLLGTDNFGRDIFSRVVQGAGATFLVAFGAVLIGLLIGIVIGALTGYYGGWLDEVLMRVNDTILAFPSILLALVMVAIMGPGKYNIILALGILFIPSFARIVRTEVAKQKNTDYVRNARLMGASDKRILFLHILPNIVPVLLSSIAIGFNNAVLSEASMSYLGVGVQPPDPSLGRMLNEAQSYLSSAPWYALSVGVAIILLILGFGLLSEGLGGAKNVR
ncbi:MAG: ABC transporter permease [Firmicutes bacterium]|nr:ABC transporter permease [Bacillota bacterium]MBQ6662398.1 ABC transporter permease [Bacillota bacterium]MCR4712686.1 ABC transporter permease [Clostridia bacterium]